MQTPTQAIQKHKCGLSNVPVPRSAGGRRNHLSFSLRRAFSCFRPLAAYYKLTGFQPTDQPVYQNATNENITATTHEQRKNTFLTSNTVLPASFPLSDRRRSALLRPTNFAAADALFPPTNTCSNVGPAADAASSAAGRRTFVRSPRPTLTPGRCQSAPRRPSSTNSRYQNYGHRDRIRRRHYTSYTIRRSRRTLTHFNVLILLARHLGGPTTNSEFTYASSSFSARFHS
jgi:hypothetical protein